MITETDPLIGETIDRFRVERVIGRGSMGTVYYGVETSSRVPVAIKTMSLEHTEDDELVQRFQREARVGNEIKHPNVAHVYKAGTLGDMPFLVMEYIDGPTLQELVKEKGPLDPVVACDLIRQAALGLKVATAKGSIHRDIKPANIMVTSKGEVKIVDFGIARNHGGDSLRTSVGVVLGSPYYMSPEQSPAQPLDLRSDIFGLGATFYFILTGRPPFEGKNLVEIIQKRARNDLKPINSINPSTPQRVVDIVAKMMMGSPDKRFQNYDELIQAIDMAVRARSSAPPPQPAVREHQAPTPQPTPQPVAARPVAPAPQPAPMPRPAQRPQPVAARAYSAQPRAYDEIKVQWYETKAAWIAMVATAVVMIGTAVYLAIFY